EARDSSEESYVAPSSIFARRETIEPIHVDQTDYDPTIYQPALEPQEQAYQSAGNHDWNEQAVEPAEHSHVAEAAPGSLEDELQNLLFGDEPQPVSHEDTYFPQVASADASVHHNMAVAPELHHHDEPHDLQLDDLQLDESAYAGEVDAAGPAEPMQTYASQSVPSSGYPFYTRSNFSSGIPGQDAVVT